MMVKSHGCFSFALLRTRILPQLPAGVCSLLDNLEKNLQTVAKDEGNRSKQAEPSNQQAAVL